MMIWLSWIVLLNGVLPPVNALPSAQTEPTAEQSDGVSINAESPFDHSWIEAYTALGDSYAAGLGAGHYIKGTNNVELNTDCYQYSYGYPNLLNANDMIGVNPNRRFQYFGCSGALANDIKDKQVPKMRKAQLVTLSAGGNDAHLATILNYCIYQWRMTGIIGLFWSCSGELDKAKKAIDAQAYTDDLKKLAGAIKDQLQGETSRIYWVAYQRFWDTTTDECDKVTWSLTKNWGFREYLTLDHRRRMNELVDDVNSKIKAVCDDTPQCVFVPSPESINALGGHFCQPGVDESYHWPQGGVSANREETWIYQWGTDRDDDTDEESGVDQPQKRAVLPGSGSKDTFEGAIADYLAQGLKEDNIDPAVKETLPGDLTAEGSFLPDRWGRVFHLNKFANGVIAMRVLDAMDAEQAKMMGEPAVTTTISTCEQVATATPTSTICEGNQVHGTCIQDSLPSAPPNSGPQPPVCNKIDDPETDYERINSDKAEQAVADYCAMLISEEVILDADHTGVKPGVFEDAAENGGSLSLTVMFYDSSCDPDTPPEEQKVVFSEMGQETCHEYFFTSLATCAQDSTWTDFNKDYSLLGGVFGIKCALWAMIGSGA